MPVNALVVGAGALGSSVARILCDGGHEVTMLECSAARVAALQGVVPGARAIVGDGTDTGELESAGVRVSDVVVALTGADEVNLLVTSLARFEFGVRRTIARIVDPSHTWLFEADMGVDVALDQADLLAHLVAEELSLGAMTTLLELGRGAYEIVEERVAPDATAAGMPVSDIPLPRECVLLAVLRAGSTTVVRGDVVLDPGDEVIALVHSGSASDLAALLGSPAHGGGT